MKLPGTKFAQAVGQMCRAAALALLVCCAGTAAASEGHSARFPVPTDACPLGTEVAVCGLKNPEDLEELSGTRWVFASGLADGALYLIDRRSLAARDAAATLRLRWDRKTFPDCPAPMNASALFGHGIAVRQGRKPMLYVVNHGQREAVEVFSITQGNGQLDWIGCIPVPQGVFANAVAPLPDNGIAITNMGVPTPETYAKAIRGENTGNVWTWSPQRQWTAVSGSEGSAPNGMVADNKGRWLYVVRTGTRDIVRLTLGKQSGSTERSARLDISPDNLRWTAQGKLLTTGALLTPTEGVSCIGDAACKPPYQVVQFDPLTLASKVIHAAPPGIGAPPTTAIGVNNRIWLGTFRGNRISIVKQ